MEALVAEERFAVGADPDRFPPMDDLSARLESLLRRFEATARDQAQGNEALVPLHSDYDSLGAVG